MTREVLRKVRASQEPEAHNKQIEEALRVGGRISDLKRQNTDLQAANNRYLERARRAEAFAVAFLTQYMQDVHVFPELHGMACDIVNRSKV